MLNHTQINVFLSFGTDWQDFALGFLKSYVGANDQYIHVFNWTGAGAILPGEELEEKIDDLISKADVFVAFVDVEYNQRMTCQEMNLALSHLQRQGSQLRIVPLLLSPESKEIIRNWQHEGAEALGKVHQEECYDRANGLVTAPPENSKLHQRILKLRLSHLRQIRKASAPVSPEIPNSDLTSVVLLDRAILPPDNGEFFTPEGAEAEHAHAVLLAAGAEVHRTTPGWFENLDFGVDLDGSDCAAAAFVQVLSTTTAAQSLEKPELLSKRLDKLVNPEIMRRSRLAYWLPHSQTQPEGLAAQLQKHGNSNPTFRGGDAEALAEWLKPRLKLTLSTPVAAYQDVDHMGRHRDMLRREVSAIVEEALPDSPDQRELHAFDTGMLTDIVSSLAKRRPILIAHNINQCSLFTNAAAIRRQTMEYFSGLTIPADEALRSKGVHPEDVFWLAILVEGNPLAMPGSLTIPAERDFRLSRWFVLQLNQKPDGTLSFENGPRRAAVRSRLLDWGGKNNKGKPANGS